jgi:predicted ArsR family transcriptional regulator
VAKSCHFRQNRFFNRPAQGYIAKLSQEMKTERKTMAFHLKQLEDMGLIEGKYLVGEGKPVTIRNYKITAQGKKIYNHIMSFK